MADTTVDGLKTLGQVLRDQRLRHGWPLKAAARRLDMKEATLGAYERGDRNPPIEALVRIFQVYGLRLIVSENGLESRIRALREELERLEAMA